MRLQVLDVTKHPTLTTDSQINQVFNTYAHVGGVPFFVEYIKDIFEKVGIEVLVLAPERIDMSKPWIINLPPSMWQWKGWTGDLLKLFPENIQRELVHGNAYLLVNHEAESWTHIFFEDIYRLLDNSTFPVNKLIYLAGATNVHEEHEKFVKKHCIPKNKQIKIMKSFHVFRRLFHPLTGFEVNKDVKKDRKFLNLNRVPRTHRVCMVSMLANRNLLNHGYVSLGLTPENVQHSHIHLKGNIIKPINPYYKEIMTGFNQIKDRIPLQVDNVNLNENQVSLSSMGTEFYEKTYFSLVSSTMAFAEEEPSPGFTEKEMKPILFKHPFIIHNLPGALKQLRSMGFLTFDRWFDESYDDETHDFERMNKICIEVDRLCKIPNDEWDRMLEEMRPTLEYNYNILVKYNVEHVFFGSDLKDLIKYVA